MRRYNPEALITKEGDTMVMRENVEDVEGSGRIYQIEYLSTKDGKHAAAFCISNPWGDRNGGEDISVGHVSFDGWICMGDHGCFHHEDSPFDLESVIHRTRYWCIAFSVLKVTRRFPHPVENF